MPPILGNIIVIAILAVVVFFAGRYCLRDIKNQLSGHGGCGSCSGNCGSCGASCGKRQVDPDPELIERLRKKD